MKAIHPRPPTGCATRALKIIGLASLAIIVLCALFVGSLSVSRSTPVQLPSPSGDYAVGRTQYDWVDGKRIDLLAPYTNTKRELLVWVWYPAKAQRGLSPVAYLPPNWIKVREADQGAGVLLEYNFAALQTHSYADAPLADAVSPYPVLIMEPGMGPVVADYTGMAEDLASHGYVVVGINPTYTSFMVVFPDGRVIPRSATGAIPDDAGPAAADQDANRIMTVWSDDVRFVMDQLEGMNVDKAGRFYGRLDLAHVGVFGHSFGGATAFYVCQRDPRCKAGANMDGTPFSAELSGTLPQPFMVMSEDYSGGCDSNCAAMQQMYAHVNGGAYFLTVSGARHFNFSDLPLRWVPLVRPLFSAVGLVGSIDPARAEQVTNAYLQAFFDQYLRNRPSPLLSGPSPAYPEVQVSKH
jgi:predicted dienelactone hydrolase